MEYQLYECLSVPQSTWNTYSVLKLHIDKDILDIDVLMCVAHDCVCTVRVLWSIHVVVWLWHSPACISCFLSSPSHSCVLYDVDTGCEMEQKMTHMSIVNLNRKYIAVFIQKSHLINEVTWISQWKLCGFSRVGISCTSIDYFCGSFLKFEIFSFRRSCIEEWPA